MGGCAFGCVYSHTVHWFHNMTQLYRYQPISHYVFVPMATYGSYVDLVPIFAEEDVPPMMAGDIMCRL